MNTKKFIFNRSMLFSVLFLIAISISATFAPYFTQYSYEEQNISDHLKAPSLNHWMGTDALGRDLYSRILYGARLSLAVGASTAVISLFVGTGVGMIAGFFGGWVDSLLMGVIEIFMIFPSILLAILLMLVMGHGFSGILISLSLTSWMGHSRLIRGQVLLLREFTYVEAAKALGGNQFQILYRHILRNLWGPIIVSLTFQIPNQIMTESFLSFIGLGLEPPYSSWGTLANEGFRAMQSFPHLIIFPGTILFFTLLSFQTFSEGLKNLSETRLDHRFSS